MQLLEAGAVADRVLNPSLRAQALNVACGGGGPSSGWAGRWGTPNTSSSAGGFRWSETENSKCTSSWEESSPGLEIRTTGHFYAVAWKGETEPGELKQTLSLMNALSANLLLCSFTRLRPGFWFPAEGRCREQPPNRGMRCQGTWGGVGEDRGLLFFLPCPMVLRVCV